MNQRPHDLEVEALVTGSADAHTSADTSILEVTGEYDLDFALPTVAALSTSITANSTTVSTPEFCYNFADGTADDLNAYNSYGDNLVDVERGTNFDTLSTTTFGLSSGVSFNAGDHYEATSAASDVGELHSDDAVFELVFQHGTGSSEIYASKYEGTTDGGWFMYSNANDAMAFNIVESGAGVGIVSSSNALVVGAWYHVLVFLDRSGNGTIYINGALDGNTSISSQNSDIDSGELFSVGGYSPAGSSLHTAGIAWLCAWYQSAWLNGGDAATALRRAHQAMGIVKGGSSLTASAESWTRASSGWVDVGGEYVQTGDNWMRANSTGLIVEDATTSDVIHSNFSSGWTEADVTAMSTAANTEDGPMGASTAARLIANSNDVVHGVCQTVAADQDVDHAFSVFAKPGDQLYVYLAETTDGDYAYFDIQNGSVGTTNTVLSTMVEAANDGYYRVGLASTTAAAGTRTYCVYTAAGDGDNDFAGDGSTINTYISNAQVTVGTLHKTPSPGGASGTSVVADVIDIDFASAIDAVDTRVTMQHAYDLIDCCDAGNKTLLTISNSGAGTDDIRWVGQAAGGMRVVSVNSTGGNIDMTDTADTINDGAVHILQTTVATNDANLYIDDTAAATATDSVCDPGPNLDSIQIGARWDHNAVTYGNYRVQKISVFETIQ
jgi:hypothetical protein